MAKEEEEAEAMEASNIKTSKMMKKNQIIKVEVEVNTLINPESSAIGVINSVITNMNVTQRYQIKVKM